MPSVGISPEFWTAVGTYSDGTYSHAMFTFFDNAITASATVGIATNYPTEDVVGEDVCTDENGNVYVLVNSLTNDYATVIKGNRTQLTAGNYIWRTEIGSGDSFYATAITYDSGYVYVLGVVVIDGQDEIMLIKIQEYTGNSEWQRRIGYAGDDTVIVGGTPGLGSGSGISIYDDLITINFATENNSAAGLNTFTLQYPVDGTITGTFGDFIISSFSIDVSANDYDITALTTSYNNLTITSAFASLIATSVAVGTGWTNTQWDLEENRQVYDPQTWKFNVDGSFDTKEIIHLDTVNVTANSTGNVSATWTFQSNNGLRFPDGSVQYGAFIETELSMDGGSAVTVFNIPPRPTVVDGGGSSSRFGINDPVYDGSNGNNYVLDGGGA
jgi:hypothetical protein